MAVVAVPVLFALGIAAATDIRIGVVLGFGLLPLVAVISAPFSAPVKLFTLYAVFNFIKMPLGEIRITGMRGASLGNVFLVVALLLWGVSFLNRGRKTRPTPWDFWGPMAFVIVPACTIIYTASFNSPGGGYSLLQEMMYLKNAAIPFFLTYLTTQLIQDRRELRLYFLVLVVLCAVATVGSLPLALRNVGQIEEWRGSRTAGLQDSGINSWACMINEIAPHYFLLLAVVFRDRLGPKLLFVSIIGGLATSLVATMSRQGLLGFGFAMVLSWSIARRAKGRIPWAILGVSGICVTASLLQFAPDLMAGLSDRFGTERVKSESSRRSHDFSYYLNRYSGDRFELWRCGTMVWFENPVFGGGYGAAPMRMSKYHHRADRNAPHSLYTGALAQGGLVYFGALAALFWITLKTFYRGLELSVARKDGYGVAICGGATVGVCCLLLNGVTLDVLLVGERLYVLGFLWGVAASYAMSLEDEELASARPVTAG